MFLLTLVVGDVIRSISFKRLLVLFFLHCHSRGFIFLVCCEWLSRVPSPHCPLVCHVHMCKRGLFAFNFSFRWQYIYTCETCFACQGVCVPVLLQCTALGFVFFITKLHATCSMSCIVKVSNCSRAAFILCERLECLHILLKFGLLYVFGCFEEKCTLRVESFTGLAWGLQLPGAKQTLEQASLLCLCGIWR